MTIIDAQIRSSARPNCFLCSAEGQVLYTGLKDHLFGASGSWDLMKCSNSKCGLIWLNPMPIEDDIWKAYKNYYTHTQSGSGVIGGKTGYQSILDAYVENKYSYAKHSQKLTSRILSKLLYLHPVRRCSADFVRSDLGGRKPGKLLEVGFGGAELLVQFKKEGWSVEGVDFDSVACELAKSKGITAYCGSLKDREFENDKFDVVLMLHVVEHVHNPAELVREGYRILKEGGVLIVATPNSESFGHLLYKRSWLHLDPPRHLYLFNTVSLYGMAGMLNLGKTNVRTIIRSNNNGFIGSHIISKFGHYDMGGRPSFGFRMIGELMGLVCWARNIVGHHSGEELVMVVEKKKHNRK